MKKRKDKIGRDRTWREKVDWRKIALKGWKSRRATERGIFDADLRRHWPQLADPIK